MRLNFRSVTFDDVKKIMKTLKEENVETSNLSDQDVSILERFREFLLVVIKEGDTQSSARGKLVRHEKLPRKT